MTGAVRPSTLLMSLFSWFSNRSRTRRAGLLKQAFPNLGELTVVDLGGGDGRHISQIIEAPGRVTVADIDIEALKKAEAKGFRALRLGDGGVGELPFATQSVDLIFCSSVIEHVTLPKADAWETTDGSFFRSEAWKSQQQFANEIRRCARSFFVQTPHRFFPIESHTWLPVLIVFLPRPLLLRVLRVTNRVWPKQTMPDWRLFTVAEMSRLFPDADIVVERVLGFPKSIMAIKNGSTRRITQDSGKEGKAMAARC